jgi:hypothetical protein
MTQISAVDLGRVIMGNSDLDNGPPGEVDRTKPDDARKVWERPALQRLRTEEAMGQQGQGGDGNQAT